MVEFEGTHEFQEVDRGLIRARNAAVFASEVLDVGSQEAHTYGVEEDIRKNRTEYALTSEFSAVHELMTKGLKPDLTSDLDRRDLLPILLPHRTLHRVIWGSYLKQYHLPESTKSALLGYLLSIIDGYKTGPGDPQKSWRNMECAEASKESFESLVTSFGIHEHRSVIEKPQKGLGSIVQRGLAKGYVQLVAMTASKGAPQFVNSPPNPHATEEIPFVIVDENHLGGKTGVLEVRHTDVVMDARKRQQEINAKSSSWMIDNPNVEGVEIDQQVLEEQTHDPLVMTPVKHGEAMTEWKTPVREDEDGFEVDVEHLLVRLYHNKRYCDVPMIALLDMKENPDDLVAMIRNEEVFTHTRRIDDDDTRGVYEYAWAELSEADIRIQSTGPVFGIFIDQDIDHDSYAQKHMRCGNVPLGLMFNQQDNGAIDVSFTVKHDHVNGVQMQAIAQSIASEIGASNPDYLPRDVLRWYPAMPKEIIKDGEKWLLPDEEPLRIADNPDKLIELQDRLLALVDPYVIESGDPNANDEVLLGLIDDLFNDLDLTDFYLSGLAPESYTRSMEGLASVLNQKILEPARAQVDAVLNYYEINLSVEERRMVLNRILTTKMTSLKAEAMVDEIVLGSTVYCGQAHNEKMEIGLVTAPFMFRHFHNEIMAIFRSGGRFDEGALFSQAPDGVNVPKEYRNNLEGWYGKRLVSAMKNMCTATTFMFFGVNPINMLKEVSEGDGLRAFNEKFARKRDPEYVNPTQVIDQLAQIMNGVRKFLNGKIGVQTEFISALSKERFNFLAKGIMFSNKGEHLSMRFNLKSGLLQRLDITSDRFRRETINEFLGFFAHSDAQKQAEIKDQINEALRLWDETVTQEAQLPATKLTTWQRIQKMTGRQVEVERTDTPAMIISEILRKNPKALKGVQYLVLAGVVGFRKRYFEAATAVANRLVKMADAIPTT